MAALLIGARVLFFATDVQAGPGEGFSQTTAYSGGFVNQQDMVVASDGSVHILLEDATATTEFYVAGTGGSFAAPVFVNNTSGVGPSWTEMDIDGNDTLHAVHDGSFETITYGSKTADGSWSFEDVEFPARYGTIAADSTNRPHISYYSSLQQTGLRYGVRNGSSWSLETVVDTGPSAERYPAIDTDSSNTPYIFYFHFPSQSLRLAVLNGSSWSIETVVSGGVVWGGALYIDGNDKLHVAYARDPNGDGNYEIYYSTKVANQWVEELVAAGDFFVNNGRSVQVLLDDNGTPWVLYSDSLADTLYISARIGGAWRQAVVFESSDIVNAAFRLTGDTIHVTLADNLFPPGTGFVQYLIGNAGDLQPANVPVTIDIKPGNKRNVINPRANGGIWVAILSDTDPGSPFDPSSQVDIPTVEFGPDGAKAIRHKVKDKNKDGLGDLLLRFKIPATGIACGDTEATLSGETFDGQSFSGTDSLKTVGCKKPKNSKKKKHKGK
jgi:hypothetical protein